MKRLKYMLGKFARRIEPFVFSPWLFMSGVALVTVLSVFNLLPKQKPDGIEIIWWLGIYGAMIVVECTCLQFQGRDTLMRETYRYKRAKFCTKVANWLDGCDIFAGILILAIPCFSTMVSAYVAILKFSLVNNGAILACTLLPSFVYLTVIGLIAFMAYQEKEWLVEAERYAQLEADTAYSRIAYDAARNAGIQNAMNTQGPVTIDETPFAVSTHITGRYERDSVNGTPISFVVTPGRLSSQAELLNMIVELNDRLTRTEKAVGRLNALIDTKVDLPKEEPKPKKSLVNNSISGLEVEDK